MSGFRLYNIEIENKLIETERISLSNKESISSDNYFTLIIGNNGTGKSRILSEVARFFTRETRSQRQADLFRESYFEYNKLPSKIIALTNSISDKFPVDKSFRPNRNDTTDLKHRDFLYNYLGTRNRINSFSNKALMNRALEIVFESYSELDVSRNYRHIFDYLNYEPIIKLNYRFTNSFFENHRGSLTPRLLIENIDKINANRFAFRSQNILNIVEKRATDICDFINNRINFNEKENEITINFSEKNISRIHNDNSIYSENVYAYDILNILRKIGLIRSFEIQVFKKGGKPFNFKDASSGEASILSTLLSLIPLLKHDSLILIDEPEISLHPLWQSRYIDLLNKILQNVNGCHVIIASHSPFIASDLNPNISSVITLKNNKGNIESEIVSNSTYGWSSEDILLNVFKMPSTRNLDLYENVSKALALLANEKRSNNELIKIQNSLKEYYPSLLDSDPMKSVIKAIFEANSNEQ